MIKLPLKITPKLTLVFVLFAALLLGGVGALAYSSGRAALEAATTSGLLSMAIEKEAALNTWIEEQQQDLTELASSPYLGEDTAHLLANPPGSGEAQRAHDRLVRKLRTWAGPGQQYQAISVIEPETGQILASTDPAEEGQFIADQPFFIHGRLGPYVQNVYYSPTLQAPAMTTAAPVRSADGRLLAVLAGRLSLEGLNVIVNRRTGLHQTDDALIVNAASIFVTQPRLLPDPVVLRQGADTLPIRRCLTGTSGVISADDYRGVPVIAVYRWLADRELCLIVKLEQAEAYAPIRSFGLTLLATGGLALALASVLAVLLARTITRPIVALQAGVARFGRGELETRLSETSGDELGQLAGEFNTMAATLAQQEAHLRRYTEELEQEVQDRTAALRESQVDLKRAQAVAQMGSWRLNVQKNELLWSDETYRMFGIPPETPLTYETFVAMIHPDDRDFVDRSWTAALRGEPYDIEHRIVVDGQVKWVRERAELEFNPPGALLGGFGTVQDITGRKQTETALRESEERVRRKLDSILSPDGDIGHLELADIIDAPKIQSLMDDFYSLAHIPMSILDLKGNLLVGVGWQRICTRFHRVHPETCRHCLESDTQLAAGIAPGEFKLYRCKNNMWDVATPIMVGGQHVGNIFSGQFFFNDEPLDNELFRAQARRYGFDEADYLAALGQVPRLSREAVDTGIAFFMKLADMLSLLSYSNLKLAQSLAERDTLMGSLRQSEERYRSLFQNNHSVMLLIDPETGAIVNANPAACVFYGYSPEEITRLKITDINQLTYEQVFAEMERARQEQRHQFFFRHRLASGEVREVEVFSGPIEFTGKKLLYSIVYDITERKRTENELIISKNNLATSQEIAHVGSYSWDLEKNLLVWSDELYRILGLTPQQLQPTFDTYANFIHPDDRDEATRKIRRVVEVDQAQPNEHRIVRSDGAVRVVQVQSKVWRENEDSPGIIYGSVQDITERKRAEDEIRQLNESLENRVHERTVQLEAANKELEAFAYSVSHDLRAPLRGIDGFSQALLEDYASQLDGRGQHYLQRVRAASQRMGQLIDDLLALSRLTRSEMHRETINLSELAQAIAADLRLVEPERRVEFVIAPNVTIRADARLIRVALENLLGNAWKFTAKHTAARIEFGTGRHGDQPVYFVRDDGAGFDMAYADKLFGAFQRLHTPMEFSGNGIGLATVKRIIHRHGGRVWAEGQVEQGATFYFTL